MTVDQNGDGVIDVDSSAATTTDQEAETKKADSDLGDTKMVDWKNHRRALDDMHRFKKEAAELKARLEEQENQKLKEKEDWKTYAEREEAKRKEAEERLNSFQGSVFEDKKYSSVREAALKAGMRPEAMSDLELYSLDGVTVEATTNGRFLVHGSEAWVDDLKKSRPYLFSNNDVANINSGGASNKAASQKAPELTPQYLLKLEKDVALGVPGAKDKYRQAVTEFAQAKAKQRVMITQTS